MILTPEFSDFALGKLWIDWSVTQKWNRKKQLSLVSVIQHCCSRLVCLSESTIERKTVARRTCHRPHIYYAIFVSSKNDHAIYVSHQSECDSGFVSVADPWCEGAIWGSGGCAPSGVQAPGAVPLVRGSGAKPPWSWTLFGVVICLKWR